MRTSSDTSLPLTKLIPLYGKTKEEEKEITKSCDLLNQRIKQAMTSMMSDGETSVNKAAGGYVATLSIRESESLNEEALIEFLRDKKEFAGCIKTKEYLDKDVLEDILYTKKIPKKLVAELDRFQVVKKTFVLTIKKEKKNE